MSASPSVSEFEFLGEEAAEFAIPLPSPPVVRRVSVDGGATSALVWGDEPAQIAFLHGGGLNAHTWDATTMALGRPVVALDLPGHGDSAWRDDLDYRAEVIAPAAASALGQLAPDAVAVVGQSLGGLTAIAVAGQRPDLVAALVIVDVSPGLVVGDGNQVRDFLAGPESFATREEIVERAASFGFAVSRAALARGVFLNTRVRDDGQIVFKHHLANRGGGEPVLGTDFRSLWPTLEQYDNPVLLVRATRGFLSDEVVDEFMARVPGAELATIDAGHNVQEDAPVELAAAINGFVVGRPPGRRRRPTAAGP
ncbi:MAG: alpha/beta hydrolase [Ilumatobacteraceae bacterium]